MKVKKASMIIFIFLLANPLIFFAQTFDNATLRITITPGKNYSLVTALGPIKITHTPQMAVWLEDATGKFIATVWVTRKSAKGAWGLPVDRPASLPIWSYKRGIESKPGIYMPTSSKPLPDSETSATPTGLFTRDWKIPKDLKPGAYIIRMEVNTSFDYNQTFNNKLSPKDPHYNAENGQPSLLYEGTLTIGDKPSNTSLKPVGYGHPLGKSGIVNNNLSVLTTALDMVSSILVEFMKK
jgi:hypothetical protein